MFSAHSLSDTISTVSWWLSFLYWHSSETSKVVSLRECALNMSSFCTEIECFQFLIVITAQTFIFKSKIHLEHTWVHFYLVKFIFRDQYRDRKCTQVCSGCILDLRINVFVVIFIIRFNNNLLELKTFDFDAKCVRLQQALP